MLEVTVKDMAHVGMNKAINYTALRRKTCIRVRRKYRTYLIPLLSVGLLFSAIFTLQYGGQVDNNRIATNVDSTLVVNNRHLLAVQVTSNSTKALNLDPCANLNGACSDICSAEYPKDYFTCDQKRKGAIILHVIGLVYMFIALAIVCDEFFVPALSVIIERLQISEDVGGATFMAAGGSAPELATAFIGTFVAKSGVGIGTIVGSAVFNILFVISMCAFFNKGVLLLTWWPLFRDICFYSLSLIVFILSFLDSKIYFYEVIFMLACYLAYVLFMKYNAVVETKVKRSFCFKNSDSNLPPESSINAQNVVSTEVKSVPLNAVITDLNDDLSSQASNSFRLSMYGQSRRRGGSISTLSSGSGRFRQGVFQLMIHNIDPIPEDSTLARERRMFQTKEQPRMIDVVDSVIRLQKQQKDDHISTITHGQNSALYSDGSGSRRFEKKNSEYVENKANLDNYNGVGNLNEALEKEEEDDDDEDVEKPLDLSWPKTTREQIIYILVAPLIFSMWLTLVDVRREGRSRFYIWTFVGSIVWVAIYSFLMAWWAKMIGEIIGIPEAIMGLTFLAAGTSIPDLITSVIVAKKGFGDMAVSSSLGSNIFDITMGLPIPWFCYTISTWPAPLDVSSKGMFCSILLLFGMLLAVVISIAAFNWKLSKGLGLAMLALYCVFITMSILLEYGHVPCPV